MRHGRHIASMIALLCMLLAAGGNSTAATTATISVSVYLDDSRPAVAMTSASPNATNAALIPVTVQFSEPVLGFDAGDVITANALLVAFAGAGANYSFNLIPEGEGAVTADIPDGVAHDTAGNLSTAAPQFIRFYDATPPTGTLVINGDAVFTRDIAVSLTLGANDSGGSGVTDAAFRNAGAYWSAWASYSPTRGWTLEGGQGYKTVEARYRDAAGNVSIVEIADTIALDTEPLAVTIAGPNPAYAAEHGSHTFETSISGQFGEPAYQWYKEDSATKALVPIPGATGPSYLVEALESGDSGSYYCEVADETETALSPETVLIVQTGLPALTMLGLGAAATLFALAGIREITKRTHGPRVT